jgi:outer membrane cobalamin receptor
VVGAARHEQRVTEAPSSVTIVTSADIATFGWRTLGEVLRNVRGFYVTYDRNYTYLGVRGFGRPTDYNNRVLLLVDGHRLNDNVYDASSIGTEFPIDVDLIDRVEVIRGPGSALYGTSAFFAVVNVITRRGGTIGGVEGTLEGGTQQTYRARASAGWTSVKDRDLIVSVSRYGSGGIPHLYFPEFGSPSNTSGEVSGMDGDASTSVFANARVGRLNLQGAFSTRDKHVPTASWGSTFDDPRLATTDSRGWFDASYERTVNGTRLAGRAFVDHMGYYGTYPGEGDDLNLDSSHGTWLGGEVSASRAIGRRQHVTVGTEYRFNASQDQKNWDQNTGEIFIHDIRSSQQTAVYLQDEIVVARGLTATLGARGDWWTLGPASVRPRAGLVYRTEHDTAFKFLYGQAFRAANVYELFYNQLGSQANPNLVPEHLTTTEAVFEQYINGRLRLTATAFLTEISDLIDQVDVGAVSHENRGEVDSRGVEFEAEHRSPSGTLVRGSIVLQHASDDGTNRRLSNSPDHLGALQIAVPVANRQVTLAFDTTFVGARTTLAGTPLNRFWLSNVVTTWRPAKGRIFLRAGVYNVFNRAYADPVGSEFLQDSIGQDGRTASMKIGVRF